MASSSRSAALEIDPQGMRARLDEYLEWLAVNNYSQVTIGTHRYTGSLFLSWCDERGLLRPSEVTRPVLERYQRHLFHYRKHNGQPLSFRSQCSRIAVVKSFFKWLARQNFLLYNPASELAIPRGEHRLPMDILTVKEVETLLAVPDVTTPCGLRDRAILETFYSTGVRRTELVRLKIFDLEIERRVLMVRLGKEKKDRLIPIGERAVAWIEKYLREARPRLAPPADSGVLFVGHTGSALSAEWLTHHVRKQMEAAGIKKVGSCHIFRHTLATLMLENGADIRYVQHMLGHSNLTSTEIYTRVSIKKLQEIHTATHPAARLERKVHLDDAGDGTTAEDLFGEIEEEGDAM